MDREIFVSIDLNGVSHRVGRLWARIRKGRESASFEYDHAWLTHPERFALEPALALGPGTFHTPAGKALFGAIGDSAPDRWGRVLMRRVERRRAEREKRTPRTLSEADFLLLVDDEARSGALRFALAPDGPFLDEPGGIRIPPVVELPRLLSAVEKIAEDREDDDDLRLLLAPGSSLGGARPKASVRDRDGGLALAKFPHRDDDCDAVRWEALAFDLAAAAGLDVPDWRVEQVAGKPVIVIRRFDRAGAIRIPFLSAMSMLGASDHEPHSYFEIADGLRQHGAATREDLKQLWRRIVFNVLISNTDDHLRNHGFLYVGNTGWRLSPAYDMNPVPVDVRPRVLSTAISPDDSTASLELALDTADYYDLERGEARKVAGEIARVVAGWRVRAEGLGLSPRETERMATAFQHRDLDLALRLGP